jgi:dienelactone hydrolase
MIAFWRAGQIGLLFALLLLPPSVHAQGVSSDAGPDGPAQTVFAPASGRGRVVMVLSGHHGPNAYQFFAAKIAKLGYYAVLLDGNDILAADRQGGRRLLKAIERAQHARQALPGRVAVIGFSQGGGGALTYATHMPDRVAIVIAYYPATSFIEKMSGNIKAYIEAMEVPVVAFAGVKDTYHDCCLIETARTMATDAKALGHRFELIEYPDAEHGFNESIGGYRRTFDVGAAFNGPAAGDAWQRTQATLKTYLGG